MITDEGLSKRELSNLRDVLCSQMPSNSPMFHAGMHPLHRAKLRINRMALANDIDANLVAEHLYSKGTLSLEDKEKIARSATQQDASLKLLDILPTKGPGAYLDFRIVLKEIDCNWLVKMLDKTHVSAAYLFDELPSRVRTTTYRYESVPGYSTIATGFDRHTCSVQRLASLNFRHGKLEAYCPNNGNWESLGALPDSVLQRHMDWTRRICAEGDGRVFIVDTQYMNLYSLDVYTRVWDSGRTVRTSHRVIGAAGVYCNGRIYITGGKIPIRSSDECYRDVISIMVLARSSDCSDVLVEHEGPMIHRRVHHQLAAVRGAIVACGGWGHSGILSACEMYCLSTRQWTRLPDLPSAIWNFALVPTPGTSLFAVGGTVKFGPLDVCPRSTSAVSHFDITMKRWASLSPLPIPLSHGKAVCSDKFLWILAGATGERRIRSGVTDVEPLQYVLQLDLKTLEWSTLRSGERRCGQFTYVFALAE